MEQKSVRKSSVARDFWEVRPVEFKAETDTWSHEWWGTLETCGFSRTAV